MFCVTFISDLESLFEISVVRRRWKRHHSLNRIWVRIGVPQ